MLHIVYTIWFYSNVTVFEKDYSISKSPTYINLHFCLTRRGNQAIYIIIAVGPLCVCLCDSELLRDDWTDLLHILGKDRYYIWPGSYLCFMTLGQRSRPPEVIEFIYLFDSM